jgi:hypothetical protein
MLDKYGRRALISLKRLKCAQLFFIYPGYANVALRFLPLIQDSGIGDRNLTLVRDPFHANYTHGVSDEIPDLMSLVEWHDSHLKECSHVTEVYTIGASSGAYGALLFGYLLRAKTVWAFGPRTARLETADAAKAVLKDILSETNGTTEYCIHYATTNVRDRAFAEYLAECPGVVLVPYKGESIGHSDHNVVQSLMDTGEIRELFPPFVPSITEGHRTARSKEAPNNAGVADVGA